MLRPKYQLLLLSSIILTIFLPLLQSGYSYVDDADIVRYFNQFKGWSLAGVFLPGGGEGIYYRPLLVLTYIFDYTFWGLESSFMHLENVLLHMGNTLLVYSIVRETQSCREESQGSVPILAALFFGVHPVNVESIAWISGRSDLLAGFFILLTILLIVRFSFKRNYLVLLLSALTGFLACVSKESSLGFLLGLPFIAMAGSRLTKEIPCREKSSSLLSLILLLSAFAAVCILFFMLRVNAFSSNNGGIGHTLVYIENNPLYSVMTVFRTFAFYLKKLFWPFPLNFTIVEVDPLYELLAVPLFLTMLWVATQRTLEGAIFITGIGLMLPAFVMAFGQIAWTPYSERYLYIPSACIVISIALALGRYHKGLRGVTAYRQARVWGVRVPVILLLVVAICGTIGRSRAWSDPLLLYRDTAEKNSDFQTARNLYGLALARSGDLAGAEREFDAARKLYAFVYDERFDLNYGTLLEVTGRYEDALAVYRKVVQKSKGKSLKAFECVHQLQAKRLLRRTDGEVAAIREEMTGAAERLKALNPPPDVYYSMAAWELLTGNRENARIFFYEAYNRALPDSPLRELSKIKLKYFEVKVL